MDRDGGGRYCCSGYEANCFDCQAWLLKSSLIVEIASHGDSHSLSLPPSPQKTTEHGKEVDKVNTWQPVLWQRLSV